MDVTQIVQIISNVGFPIACTGALFWLVLKQNELHRQESAQFREALDNNTKALQEVAVLVKNNQSK